MQFLNDASADAPGVDQLLNTGIAHADQGKFSGREESIGFPPVNIHETPEAYHLELSAPGRNKEDFKLSVDNGQLTISFEKKEETKTEEYKTIRKEFSFKSFKRSFNLDDRIDANGIQAKYENGVLKLLLPKKEQVKESTKQISVQ